MRDAQACQHRDERASSSWGGKLFLVALVLLVALIGVRAPAILDAAQRLVRWANQPVASRWQVALYVLGGSLGASIVLLFVVASHPYRLLFAAVQEHVLWMREDGIATIWEERIRDRFLEQEAAARGAAAPSQTPSEPASDAELAAGWETAGTEWWTKL